MITGAQIGMLISLHELDNRKFAETIQEILDKQYVGNTTTDIMKDIEKIKLALLKNE